MDLARPLLFERLQDLERTALGDLTDYGQLHQVRIAGKRLRYAMEVFADCFDPAFRVRSIRASSNCKRSSAEPMTAMSQRSDCNRCATASA